MGFRDLSCFNKALLAKQLWRLWKTPESLIARIMKAKYFPDCSVLEASLGKKPSFAWRSIHSSMDLLQEGLVWRVGNGKTIRIWKDRWLNTPTTYRVQSPPKILADNATVSLLIDANTKWWNLPLLERIFSKEERAVIQSFPISATDQADLQIWRGTKNGVFSVRSAYHILKENEVEQEAGGSSCSLKSSIWKSIWQLQIPNAEKHFLWRACREILPTRDNLCKRRVLSDPICPICEREPETTFHALWQCPSARDVWSAGRKLFQKSRFDGPDFMQVVDSIFSRGDRDEVAQFVSITRRIWLRRNGLVHEGSFLHPNRLVQQAIQAVEQFQTMLAEKKEALPSNSEQQPVHWMAPTPGYLKANWDAGFDRQNGRLGMGVIIRDQQGKMWASKCQTKEGVLDVTTGEALAALMAAELCVEMGITKVQLEGDAKTVVLAVISTEPDDSNKGQVTADIRATLRAVPWWEMKYTRRDANRAAHALAELAVRQNVNRVWFSNPPDCISVILRADISAGSVSL
jgi:ribonuclease HI